jgi:beta-xylosidase
MKSLIFLCYIFCAQICIAQQSDDLDLNKRIAAVDSANIFIDKDYYIWCGSAIQGEDRRYYLFYSRWPHGKRELDDDSLNYIFDGFRGWQKYSEIAIAVSDSATGPYRHLKTILKGNNGSVGWDRYTFHNPQVNYFKGRYYLYFISNGYTDSMRFTRQLGRDQLHWYKYNCTQKIGVASAATIQEFLNGSFYKKPEYLIQPDSIRTWEVAVNPSVTEGPDGRYYMMYKSRKPDLGHMTFWVAVAPKPEGPFTHFSEVSTRAELASEDPYLWYDKKRRRFYAIAKYFSPSGKLVDEFGSLILLTSSDAKEWQQAKKLLVSNKKLMMKDGTITRLAHLERPFLLFDRKGKMKALFAAASVENPFNEKTRNVTSRNNTFNVHIPLKD